MISEAVLSVLSRGEVGCVLGYKLLLVMLKGENSCPLRYCLFVVECRCWSENEKEMDDVKTGPSWSILVLDRRRRRGKARAPCFNLFIGNP